MPQWMGFVLCNDKEMWQEYKISQNCCTIEDLLEFSAALFHVAIKRWCQQILGDDE